MNDRAATIHRHLTALHNHQATATSETCIHCGECGQPWPCKTRRDYDGMGKQ